MKTLTTRRQFLKRGFAFAGAAAGLRLFNAPSILSSRSPNSKLGVAFVGAWGRAHAHLSFTTLEPSMQVVALTDIDENRLRAGLDFVGKVPEYKDKVSQIKTYYDYRKMFEEMEKQIDAVFVAIPDHSHASAVMIAMKLGKHVYCEKPLTHDISEARALGEAARKYKVMTQMGNQGHAGEGLRAIREYIEAGAIGTVTETHTWMCQNYSRFNKPRPIRPVPPGVHWDEWIGPGKYREYCEGLAPAAWYNTKDYGAGLIAAVGVHTFDAVHWGLQLKYPSSCVALAQEGMTEDDYGSLNTVCFEFPRPSLPPLKAYFYDGDKESHAGFNVDAKQGLNHPALADELSAKYGRDLWRSGDQVRAGTIFVGDKAYMISESEYCGAPRIIPEEKHKEFPVPPKKYTRTRGIQADFLRAVTEGGEPPCSNFSDVSGPYVEALLVGQLAMRAGVGRKVEWDGVNMKCTNIPELNRFVKQEYRKGWTL
ncbi:MAG: Gfo/Idh/MocA family oxidoreductase [Kiritimatiellae bacterium]|nr:Gfo/Idh/MocA family oxidoreductase [Kiritimatiellia bacterium]